MKLSERLIDQQFGRLQVIMDSGIRNNNGDILWLCECECGNGRLATSKNLHRNEITECQQCAKKYRKKWGKAKAFHEATLPPSAIEDLGLEEL